ncbi:hypothetical protein B0H34DRAFT_460434 [Crassisporium funariophilum]|nr:hypothetical protein B0H34DRAFT_460434 [Crassisporium funariophilum]
MQLRIDNCLWLASNTLLIFDYICTLQSEISYVWSCPRSIGLILFYLNRYLPFVDCLIMFSNMKLVPYNIETCIRFTSAASWVVTIGMLNSQMIILLRTYAMWGRKRSIKYILLASGTVVFGVHFVILAVQAAGISGALSRIKASGRIQKKSICSMMTGGGSNRVLVFYSLICFDEILVVILTVIKAKQHLRQSSSLWVVQLYKNGIIYCLCMLSLSLLNSMMIVAAPGHLKPILFPFQRVLHSIFCNRVILLILKNRQPILGRNHQPNRLTTLGDSVGMTTSYTKEERDRNGSVTEIMFDVVDVVYDIEIVP